MRTDKNKVTCQKSKAKISMSNKPEGARLSQKTQAFPHPVGFVLVNKVHFVYEAEDLCISGILKDCLEAGLIVVEVTFKFTAFYIKYVDENLDISEYALSLTGDVALHE